MVLGEDGDHMVGLAGARIGGHARPRQGRSSGPHGIRRRLALPSTGFWGLGATSVWMTEHQCHTVVHRANRTPLTPLSLVLLAVVQNRTHSGFRNWMFERLQRLRERLARARAAAAAEGRLMSAEAAAEVEEAATREYEQEETARLVRELSQRRQEQRAELVRRDAQSRATIEERIRQERWAQAQAAGQELGSELGAVGGSDGDDDDEEDEAEAGQRRRGRAGDYWAGDGEDEAEAERRRQQQYREQQAVLRQRYQQQQYMQQRAGGGPYGARPRGDGSGDYLAAVTPGRHAWSRPGAKVPEAQPPRQRQYPGGAGGGRYPQGPGAWDPQSPRGQPRPDGGRW